MTIKNFTDLTGLKEKNIAELESIGITTIDALANALHDEHRVKEIIKTLSRIGPKTVEKWKSQIFDTKEVTAEGKEIGKNITSESENIKVEEKKKYTPSIKPSLDAETKSAIMKREVIDRRRPNFKRQEWFRYSKLEEVWRRPKGIHSKMKRNLKRRPPVVDIGFRGPTKARGLHSSGFEEIFVCNVTDLEKVVDAKIQAVRISGTVGTKKRIDIQNRAKELGIRILNEVIQV
ncbi:MAG: 50S ribosomal protein L32e [archaeon]|nr:50S ribosomal protein L32e [archaeon]